MGNQPASLIAGTGGVWKVNQKKKKPARDWALCVYLAIVYQVQRTASEAMSRPTIPVLSSWNSAQTCHFYSRFLSFFILRECLFFLINLFHSMIFLIFVGDHHSLCKHRCMGALVFF
jgi:hypothetical protein